MNKIYSKSNLIILSIIFFNLSCQPTSDEVKHSKKDRIDLANAQEIEMTMDPATQTVPRERLLEALRYMKSMSNTRAAIPGITWNNLGPNNQAGRTRTMLIDISDNTGNTLFVGSVGGGLWKTSNATSSSPSWVAINDFMQNIAISTLAQDPNNPNIIYAGTGEAQGNQDAIRGLGIFKSTDGGNTWNQLAATNNSNFYYCTKIIITNTGTLLAATKSGLYRSTNGGSSFTKVLGTGLGITGAINNLCWDVELASNGDIYAGLQESIHKSTNDGITFQSAQTIPVTAERIELACALSSAGTVYALLEESNVVKGIIQTTNGGTTWTSKTEPADADGGIPATDFSRGQAWYDLSIAVDPNNANVVFVGGIDLFKSTNSGNTWTQISHWYGGFGFPEVHADQHNIIFAPGSSSTVYFCNDGGLYRSTNATSSTPSFAYKSSGCITIQFYGCDMHPGSDYYLAGSQDNGSHRFNGNALQNTVEVTGGDGAYCNIDQNEPNYQYNQYVYNQYRRSTNGGNTWTNVNLSGSTGRFINPSDFDDVNNRLYAAANADRYLRWDNPHSGNTFSNVTVNLNGEKVSAVTVSPTISNRIYLGTGAGEIFRINNAHTNTPTMTDITNNLNTGYLNCIAVDSLNENHLLVVSTSYGVNSVWETSNGGTNWTSVEGNLPDMPVRWVLFHPTDTNQALIATELGVWTTDNLNGAGTVWGPSNTGLANVRVDMLRIRSGDKRIIASTHGRGLFTSGFFSPPTADFVQNRNIIYQNQPVQFTDISSGATSYFWDFGDGSTSAQQSPSHVYNNAGVYNVTLTINGGPISITKTNAVHVLPNLPTPYSPSMGGDFETNAYHFAAQNLSGTSWERGNSTVSGKNGTHNGSFAWVTGLTANNYVNNSESILYSPNFNFDLTGNYFIKFYRKMQFEQNYDGFNVEYSLDTGYTWTVLGSVATNWYDNNFSSSAFLSAPFFNNDQTSYTLATYDISFLATQPNVAFRIRFKSDFGVTDIGAALDDFEITAPLAPLPLEIKSFTAETIHDQEVLLNWKTVNESEINKYRIFRSWDGMNYQEMGEVKANNLPVNYYNYKDISFKENPGYGKIFYKLGIIDNNLQIKYSDVREVLRTPSEEVFVYPNPARQSIDISSPNDIYDFHLYDFKGRLCFQVQKPGKHIILSNKISSGVYFAYIRTKGKTYKVKLLIE